MKKVPFIDQSGLYALEEVIKEMHKNGIIVVLTMLQEQPLFLFEKNKFIPNVIQEKYLFKNIEDCAIWLKQHSEKSEMAQ